MNMKKAEIIKNGNVNLKTVKSGKKVNKEIDLDNLKTDYYEWIGYYFLAEETAPSLSEAFEWFRNRLS